MAIEVQGLEIQIGARTLLHPTNFHVAKGDKIGLVGRNGAGKTTLTRVIMPWPPISPWSTTYPVRYGSSPMR